MARLLVKHVNQLVTCDDNDRVLQHVNVLTEDSVIVQISEGEERNCYE